MDNVEIKENAVYTLEEACMLFKTSDASLRRKIKEGIIHYTKLGRQYRFLGRDLLDFLSKNRDTHLEDLTLLAREALDEFETGQTVNLRDL